MIATRLLLPMTVTLTLVFGFCSQGCEEDEETAETADCIDEDGDGAGVGAGCEYSGDCNDEDPSCGGSCNDPYCQLLEYDPPNCNEPVCHVCSEPSCLTGSCCYGKCRPDAAYMELCNVATAPDYSYDICVEGNCYTPGACGHRDTFACNSPGPHFKLPPDAGHHDFTRTETVPGEPEVVDNVTGLVWQGSPSKEVFSFEPDLSYCENLFWGGYDDWYLPDRYELQSIIDYGKSPAIDTEAFPDVLSAEYWASTVQRGGCCSRHLLVGFDYGRISSHCCCCTTSCDIKGSVMCVRRGRHAEGGRFLRSEQAAGEPVVADEQTGLMWQGCSAGQSGSRCDIGDSLSTTWVGADSYCESLNWGLFSDWRLPNVKELSSLTDDRNFFAPAIDATQFPETPWEYYWSSRTYVIVTSGGRSMNEHIVEGDQNATFKVRCVRNVPM